MRPTNFIKLLGPLLIEALLLKALLPEAPLPEALQTEVHLLEAPRREDLHLGDLQLVIQTLLIVIATLSLLMAMPNYLRICGMLSLRSLNNRFLDITRACLKQVHHPLHLARPMYRI
jgi:lipopolysaccharide/colanic/teichoic acid biosynthesis glycosyltransferase